LIIQDLKTDPANTNQPGSFFHPAIRLFAHFFSVLLHPLFVTSYATAFLIFVHPFAFAGLDPRLKLFRFLTVFLSTTFLPLLAVFLVWRLGLFVKSFRMNTARERLVPYLIAMTLYWWPWNVYRNLTDIPMVANRLLFGSFLSICGAWMCNIFFKISIHAVAMGSLFIFFLLFSFSDSYGSGLYLSIVLLLTGIVCTSRLIVSDHSPFEIYSGLALGMIMQWIAWQISPYMVA
jgi:hypothetical protein